MFAYFLLISHGMTHLKTSTHEHLQKYIEILQPTLGEEILKCIRSINHIEKKTN